VDEGEILFGMFNAKPPPGTVRVWIDDGQEGGWIEYMTPEQAEAHYAALEGPD